MSSDPHRAEPVAGLDRAFTALRDRAPEPSFAPAAAVRHQGRRRTHRQIVAAAIAVVAVLVGGALVAGPRSGGRVEPAASPGPSLPVAPTDHLGVAGRLLLQPADLPPGYWYTEDPEAERRGTFPIPIACVDDMMNQESTVHRQAQRAIRFHTGDDRRLAATQSAGAPDRPGPWAGPYLPLRISHNVTMFEPGWAMRGMADYRAWISTCPGRAEMTYTPVHRDFVGDESVVYRVQQPPEGDYYLAIVRIGDRVAVLWISRDFTADAVRDLATKAGRRLES
jgi:hypothetical protein